MTTYRYRGQSLDGAKVTGVIRAYDEFEAVSQLRDRCAFITKIEPVKEKQGNPLTRPVNTRIREKELAMLCSQLSILLSSGLTALRCLQMVATQTRNKQLRRALEKAAEEVGAGRSMADSLESNREVRFPATFVETVRAGEQSGSLEACLKRLQGYYERSSTAMWGPTRTGTSSGCRAAIPADWSAELKRAAARRFKTALPLPLPQA